MAAEQHRPVEDEVAGNLKRYFAERADYDERLRARREANQRTIPKPPYRAFRDVDGVLVRPCRWCDQPIWLADGRPDMRRLWHPDCADEYMGLASQQGLRARCERRDGGRCANCDTVPLCLVGRRRAQVLFAQMSARRSEVLRELGIVPYGYGLGGRDPWWDVRLRPFLVDDDWEADHIEPLWAGGQHSLDNVQTLCRPCHVAKTTYEAGIRAWLKRGGDPDNQLALEIA